MPGILPMKVIKVGSSAQARIAQACDRCRSKKIRCDGFRPSCSQCANVGFECKTSDKLSRRAFPRGYTESLEERVRALESEIRELKDLLDAKDDKIDMLSKLHPSGAPQPRRQSSYNSFSDASSHAQPHQQDGSTQHFRMHQQSSLHEGSEHEPRFVGTSNSCAMIDSLKEKAVEAGRSCPEFDSSSLAPATGSKSLTTSSSSSSSPESSPESCTKGPSRLLSDQMVNIFFQEWAPMFPILHRPSFLATYEQYVTDADKLDDMAALIQLHLVFGIATLSNKTRIAYDTSSIESHWLRVLETNAKTNSLPNLQGLLLAQMYCVQIGDWARVLRLKELSASMAHFLGLNQSQKRFNLGILPCETRKKVFWSLYTLDSFISAMLGTPRSLNDHDIHCEYPMDVDDEYISEQGIQPVLPGEFTKLSSALSVFQGARIMAKVLTELYPSHTTYEVSLGTVSSLESELDAWSDALPPHLKMQFTDEKPSTHVISSRCPLLSLTYHYIRTLIHRPAACFAPHEMASASTVALAGSSKHMIQILQLLDERHLAFSFCLNKDELLITAGVGVMLQSLSLSRESKLMKDSQKTVCAVMEMLKRRQASEYSAFRSIGCPLMFLNADRRPTSSSSSSEVDSSVKAEPHLIAARYPSSSRSYEQLPGHDHFRSSLPVLTSTPSNATASSGSLNKRFRAIAPSITSSRSSHEHGTNVSAKTSVYTGHQVYMPHEQTVGSVSATSSAVNLDFFRFPADAPPHETDKARMLSARERPMYRDFEKILSTFGTEQWNIANEVHDWNSLSANVPPPEEVSVQQPPTKPYPALARSTSYDAWPVRADAPTDTQGPRLFEPVKANSLLSLSEESLTSGEDFSSIDWGTSSGEGDDAFRAMMASLTPEEATVFGLSSDDTPYLHAEA